MFEEKKENKKEEYLKVDDVVYCNGCGVMIKKGFEQKVESNFYMKSISNYCKQCKKPYETAIFYGDKIHYFTEVEVDVNGKPIEK